MNTKDAKNAKIIGIGGEGIKTIDSILDKVKGNMDFEKININQDVDKEYVRNLLDGVEILILTYSSEDKRAKEIVKAISYMAGERRVLSIGLDTSSTENKDELGLNREFKLFEDNFEKVLNLINMIIESISYSCMINIDLTDLKEVLAADKGIKYSYEEFDKNKGIDEIVQNLVNNLDQIGNELLGKKAILFVDMDNNYCEHETILVNLNEIITKIEELSENTYEMIFSLYIKEKSEGKIRFGLIYN
ncbi:cell division protein [Romboutsia maritimum]|uniref:Cell division protein n=1 Tax=Romboutsia maritimum TaxID=2020948 RepID=A0A371ISM3_9FIRM|nr:cell division protein [Romboutsia maritimum]RDY23482.1 cell division protein [Romboutsia maritimum]